MNKYEAMKMSVGLMMAEKGEIIEFTLNNHKGTHKRQFKRIK